eukprot:gnl/TRDRNA2_/TRDRNA2_81482_c0_seq1.p1 gnl/TRDRNA2_/TRDRNA2_81482_c0~~gnl/TRDRNA2_/TRDRNA2_81482_c0_seq1.p1  ORF type:complete len:495 (+),score=79.40 gnl/TRDRNA2_/TRDRNA2_81482_c0_seq1:63-1547(+)
MRSVAVGVSLAFVARTAAQGHDGHEHLGPRGDDGHEHGLLDAWAERLASRKANQTDVDSTIVSKVAPLAISRHANLRVFPPPLRAHADRSHVAKEGAVSGQWQAVREHTPQDACPQITDVVAAKAPAVAITAALATAAAVMATRVLDTPSREYKSGSTVGKEYDAWTEEGILEYYWGEHIHLGFYTDEERRIGYKQKDFKQAKFDFVDQMFRWGMDGESTDGVATVLDVGCGIGGTSRYLAKRLLPDASVTGITLSEKQVRRATELAKEQEVPNVKFQVMDALNMGFPDNSFDLVWACESGEHMPDKVKYVNEMLRVLKPNGKLIIATWCQRDNVEAIAAAGGTQDAAMGQKDLAGFTEDEKKRLDFLYREWSHPYFISYEEYARVCHRSGLVAKVETDDWAQQTLPSWRHSVWAGVWDPWTVFSRPHVWYKTLRDIVTLERMHRAFEDGLLTYGMIKATKTNSKDASTGTSQPTTAASPDIRLKDAGDQGDKV